MFTICSLNTVNIRYSFYHDDVFLPKHMLFMRFPWCDYDKEALRASDREKKRGKTAVSIMYI